MITKQVTIINKLGLHARAASRFVSVTTGYTCQIKVTYNNQQVDGKSIMAIMMLAAGQGAVLELVFEGDDEQAACQALCQLIDNYFDEGE